MIDDAATGGEALVARIATRLQRLRKARGISASGLARQAGIAKSTLTQLELGHGNPGIETLWAIASALEVSFAELVAPSAPEIHVVRAHEAPLIQAENTGMEAALIARLPASAGQSLYRIVLAPRAMRKADAHAPGVVEHVTVSAGTLTTGPADEPVRLEAGDYMQFPADRAHIYQAATQGAVALMILAYG